MARYFKRKKIEILLAVMLLLDYSAASPLPSPTSGPRIIGTTKHQAHQPGENNSRVSKPVDNVDDLQAEVEHLINVASNVSEEDETDLNHEASSEDEDDDTINEFDYIINQREKMATDDLQMKALQIMQDVDTYNSKVQSQDDVRDTIRASCGHDVVTAVDDVTVSLGEEQDVMTVMTIVALLQLHQCPSAATTITSRLVVALDNLTAENIHDLRSDGIQKLDTESAVASHDLLDDTVHQPRQGDAPSRFLSSVDFCDKLEDCKKTGIPLLRKELARHPSLLAVYDVAVAAVFTSTTTDEVAKALIDDITADLNITISVHDLNITTHHKIRKRSSCVNKQEATAQSIVTWIPFIGTVYNLVSAIAYSAKRCDDVAKERAIEGAIDFAMDLGTVVTLGLGAPAFQAAKVAAKGATKQVIKATAKKSIQKSLKKPLTKLAKSYLNPFKGAATEIADLAKGVGKLAKAATSLAKKGGQAAKEGLQRLTKSGAKHGDDVNLQAIGKSSSGQKATNVKAPQNGPMRCTRSPGGGGCIVPRKQKGLADEVGTDTGNTQNRPRDETNTLLDDVDNQYGRRGSAQARSQHADRWDDLWNRYKIEDKSKLPLSSNNMPYKELQGIDLTKSDLTNKKLFEALQEETLDTPLYVKQKLGGLDVEYIARPQPWKNSKDQLLVSVGVPDSNGKLKMTKPASYEEITKKLDDFAENSGNVASKRKEMADAMQKAVYDPPNSGQDLKAVLGNDRGTQKAASEFIVITQLAEAVPARIKGMDAYFRSGLKKVADGKWTFKQFREQAGLVTQPKTLNNGRSFVQGTDNAERMAALRKTGSDPNAVHDTVNGMSDPDRRRRK